MTNEYVRRAQVEKRDEFYTKYNTIELELKHYAEHLKDKIIYCNCDNYEVSNFVKYFNDNFEKLQLRGLISTDYLTGNVFERYSNGELTTWNAGFNISYDSELAVDYLKKSDYIITNPPFSQFRKYINFLFMHNKQFLVLGNSNTIMTKDLFHYIMDGQMWYGVTIRQGDVEFTTTDEYTFYLKHNRVIDGVNHVHVNSVRWLTNIGARLESNPIPLVKKYTPEEYPKYDNFDAINVNSRNDIPYDYYGPMGVPISFMDKFNSKQFKIIGKDIDMGEHKLKVNGRTVYTRIIIIRNT